MTRPAPAKLGSGVEDGLSIEAGHDLFSSATGYGFDFTGAAVE